MDERFEIASCGANDREEQARLFNACFRKGVDADGLGWRYDRGPHGGALSFLSRPVASSGERADGVSGYACSPRHAAVLGEHPGVVGETGDVMTHPEWRKRGLFSDLDRACRESALEAGWVARIGLPNRHSAHIFEQLGWEVVGRVHTWTHVLRTDARSRAARLGDGRLAAWATPWGMFHGGRARRALARRLGSYRVEPLEAFPVEVGDLAERVAHKFGFMIRRDAEYLTWRYLRGPAQAHRPLAVCNDQGFVGYAVVQPARDDSGIGWLVDVLAEDDRARDAAVVGGLEALRASGASVARATALEGSWWEGVLQEAGFCRARPERHGIVILDPLQADHALVRAARETASWYFTDGDRDDETMG